MTTSNLRAVSFINCAMTNATTVSGAGNGLHFADAGGAAAMVKDCIFYGNSVYGMSSATAAAGNLITYIFRNNAFGANGTANYSNITAESTDVTLTGNPFVSSTDFGLNSTAGAGAACKGAGVTNLGSANAARDIGPIPSGGGAAGGGGGGGGGGRISHNLGSGPLGGYIS